MEIPYIQSKISGIFVHSHLCGMETLLPLYSYTCKEQIECRWQTNVGNYGFSFSWIVEAFDNIMYVLELGICVAEYNAPLCSWIFDVCTMFESLLIVAFGCSCVIVVLLMRMYRLQSLMTDATEFV